MRFIGRNICLSCTKVQKKTRAEQKEFILFFCRVTVPSLIHQQRYTKISKLPVWYGNYFPSGNVISPFLSQQMGGRYGKQTAGREKRMGTVVCFPAILKIFPAILTQKSRDLMGESRDFSSRIAGFFGNNRGEFRNGRHIFRYKRLQIRNLLLIFAA